jgi:hypothetical protein
MLLGHRMISMNLHPALVPTAWLRMTLVILFAVQVSGCNVVGPMSLAGGRAVYAEVVNTTEDEQLLNVIVRQRYDESAGMLSVASITANLRFRAQAGTSIGIGDRDNYAGNLTPFSAGVAYEENPTISYVPLSGEDFMRRMLAPVSTREYLLVEGPSKEPGWVFALAVRRINGLRNPLIGDDPPSADFERFIHLYRELRRDGKLTVVHDPVEGSNSRFYWAIHGYTGKHLEMVREVFGLLGIAREADGSTIMLPVRRAFGHSDSSIHIQSRSAYDVLRVFGAGVEVPAEHLEAGIVEPIHWVVPEERRFIQIHSSRDHWWSARPSNAVVAIRFRDRWFYIDATDTRSKRAFQFLRTFIGIRLADPTRAVGTPVLTVPVN